MLIDSTQQQDGHTVLYFLNDRERVIVFDDEHFFVHSLEDGELSTEKIAEIIEKILQSGLNTAY